MKEKLTLNYSLEWLTLATSCVVFLAVIYTFIIGKHFVIPTALLGSAVALANLGYYGIQNKLWARGVLFWVAVIICAHTFFALFWAKTPRDLLGQYFFPVYTVACLGFGYLAWVYSKFAFAGSVDD